MRTYCCSNQSPACLCPSCASQIQSLAKNMLWGTSVTMPPHHYLPNHSLGSQARFFPQSLQQNTGSYFRDGHLRRSKTGVCQNYPLPPCLWASPRHWTGLDVRKVRSRKRCGLTNGSSKHQRCFYPWKTKLALSEASLARTPIKNTNFNTNTMNYKDIYPRIGVLLHSSHGITCEGPSDLH